MVDNFCDICGEAHNLKYVHTLDCNHCFHYDCIMKTFMMDIKKYNKCPLCRKSSGLLPLINGLPKIIKGIHYITEYPSNYQSTKCSVILKSGKRKGQECGSKCIVGFDMCKRHHISKIKKETSNLLNA
jgi:hypothetical protein